MKTIPFAGFKIKLLTSLLIPKNRVYIISSHSEAKNFIAILESLDKLISSDKIRFIVRKPKEKIVRLS